MRNFLRHLLGQPQLERTEKLVLTEKAADELQQAITELEAPAPPQPVKHGGRVIKSTKRAEYTPNVHRHGGRIIKVMPKELQKIKEAQEKQEDHDGA